MLTCHPRHFGFPLYRRLPALVLIDSKQNHKRERQVCDRPKSDVLFTSDSQDVTKGSCAVLRRKPQSKFTSRTTENLAPNQHRQQRSTILLGRDKGMAFNYLSKCKALSLLGRNQNAANRDKPSSVARRGQAEDFGACFFCLTSRSVLSLPSTKVVSSNRPPILVIFALYYPRLEQFGRTMHQKAATSQPPRR